MEDLISRKEAMKELTAEYNRRYALGEKDGLRLAWIEKAINSAPSVSIEQIKWERDTAIQQLHELGYDLGQKPKKGKWIRTRTMTHDGELYCSECEQEHPEQKIIWNFCPNCGARMVNKDEID